MGEPVPDLRKIKTEWHIMQGIYYNTILGTVREALSNIKGVLTWRKKEPGKTFDLPQRRKKNNSQTLCIREQNMSTKDLTNLQISKVAYE